MPGSASALITWVRVVSDAAVAYFLNGASTRDAKLSTLFGQQDSIVAFMMLTILDGREAIQHHVPAKYRAESLRRERHDLLMAQGKFFAPYVTGHATELPDDAATQLWKLSVQAAPTLAPLWRYLSSTGHEGEKQVEGGWQQKFLQSAVLLSGLEHVARSKGSGEASSQAYSNELAAGTLFSLAQMAAGVSRGQLRIPAALGLHVYPTTLTPSLTSTSRRPRRRSAAPSRPAVAPSRSPTRTTSPQSPSMTR